MPCCETGLGVHPQRLHTIDQDAVSRGLCRHGPGDRSTRCPPRISVEGSSRYPSGIELIQKKSWTHRSRLSQTCAGTLKAFVLDVLAQGTISLDEINDEYESPPQRGQGLQSLLGVARIRPFNWSPTPRQLRQPSLLDNQRDYDARMTSRGVVPGEPLESHEVHLAVDALPTLVWSARSDGSADFFNQPWLTYTGLSAERAMGWGWQSAIHLEDLPRMLRVFQEAVDSRKPFEVEGRLRRDDGEFRWFLFRGNPLFDESGRLVKWYGTNVDIEDRKRVEDALRGSERRLALLVDSIPGLVSITSAEGELEHVNRQGLEYFGKTLEELKQWDTSDDTHPDDLPHVITAWRHSIETGQPYHAEYRYRRADGVYRWFQARGVPARDADGRIVRWYLLITDIDDRKRAEIDLQRAFEEIKRLKDRLHDENVILREHIDQALMFEEIVGSSVALKRVLSSIVQVASTDTTVLITGETGTGKELIARAVHKRSRRSSHAFVSVNCASIPASLIASELFGHEKGAFTGAVQQRRGRFELAHSGTIFLDEVGELPAETQIALLRVLQERQFERLGGSHAIHTDVRVVAATNRDLSSAIAAGTFRVDLFYRLNVFPISIPPLRDRSEDIPMLVEYFVKRYADKARKHITKIDKKAMQLFLSSHWPGNIRELQNIVERSVILCNSGTLWVDEAWLAGEGTPLRESSGTLTETLERHEREIIEAALARSKGKVSGPDGAAVRLGMKRSTLDLRIKQLKIKKDRLTE